MAFAFSRESSLVLTPEEINREKPVLEIGENGSRSLMNQLRVAIVCDLVEEGWPSMDLVAEMLLDHLGREHSDVIVAKMICPPMRRRFTRHRNSNGKRFNADRFINRFWDYPHFARRLLSEFDLFHVIDHSYGQLVHELPSERTVITCHDLDTFQCLLDPAHEPRSIFFRKMMNRSLSGFRRAARVTCDSVATRTQLLARDLVPAERAVVVPNGVHPSCSPAPLPPADAKAAKMLGTGSNDQIDLLHVGSTIPRKRIDVLLKVFSGVRDVLPSARLLHVGGAFTAEQSEILTELRLHESVLVLPKVGRDILASLYRRAALVLLPSEREGFGLPIVEAMACGTPVVASDLDVLREVGGSAATYCPVGEVAAWSQSVTEMLRLRCTDERQWDKLRTAGITQAAKFTWSEYASRMVNIYKSLATAGGSH